MENNSVLGNIVFLVGCFCAVDSYTGGSIHFQHSSSCFVFSDREMVVRITGMVEHKHPIGVVGDKLMHGVHASRTISATLSREFLNEMFLRERRGDSVLFVRCCGSVRFVRFASSKSYCQQPCEGE